MRNHCLDSCAAPRTEVCVCIRGVMEGASPQCVMGPYRMSLQAGVMKYATEAMTLNKRHGKVVIRHGVLQCGLLAMLGGERLRLPCEAMRDVT